MIDAFTEDDPASHQCLRASLLSPEISALLWQSGLAFRTESWPTHLRPILDGAARQNGFLVTPINAVHMFAKEGDAGDAKAGQRLRYVNTVREEQMGVIRPSCTWNAHM